MPQLSIGNFLFAMQFGATGALFAPQEVVEVGVSNGLAPSSFIVFYRDWRFAPDLLPLRQGAECRVAVQPPWRLDKAKRVKPGCAFFISESLNKTPLKIPGVQ